MTVRAALLALLLMTSRALACGVCVEDKIASTYDHAAIKQAVARKHSVDGVLTISASEHRSQLQNREAALERMARVLAEALAPPSPKRRPTRVSKGAVERRLADKRLRAQTKKLRRVDED